MMIQIKYFKTLSVLLSCVLVLGFFTHVHADTHDAKTSVEIYGQTLKPQSVKVDVDPMEFPDYDWSHLERFVADVLPGSMSSSMSSDDLCDHIVKLHGLYVVQSERQAEPLAGVFIPAAGIESETSDPFYDRLGSPDPRGLEEVLKAMPDQEEQVMLTYNIMRKEAVLRYLHDAALLNCPAHAKEKGYVPVLSYDGDDKDYVPSACKGDDAPDWCP